MSLFFNLGRGLGYAALPVIKKSKLAWQSLAGTGAETQRAESEFGRALAAELRLRVGVVNDQMDLALVRKIMQRLSARVKDKQRVFRIDVLLEQAPTAMALPGGFIFLSDGLLNLCERQPDELAFVIGHEMGHVIRGHALQRMLTRIGIEGFSAIVSRGLLNSAIRQSGLKWLESSHAPEAEFEADEFAVRIASRAVTIPPPPCAPGTSRSAPGLSRRPGRVSQIPSSGI